MTQTHQKITQIEVAGNLCELRLFWILQDHRARHPQSHISVENAEKGFQLNQGTQNINNFTVQTRFKDHFHANFVQKGTHLYPPLRCISEHIPCHASVKPAGNLFRGLGFYKVMFELIREKSRSPVTIVHALLLTNLIWELIFKLTYKQKSILAQRVIKHSAECLCLISTPMEGPEGVIL